MGKKMKKACVFILANMMGIQPIYAYTPLMEAEVESELTTVEIGEAQNISCEVTGDTYVWDKEKTTNYGTSEEVVIKTTKAPNYTRYGYYAMDLSNIQEPYVKAAKLKIYFKKNYGSVVKGNEILTIYEAEPFEETTITWGNKPVPSKKVGQVKVNREKTGQYVEIDLTDYINEELAKGEVLGTKYLAIKIDDEHYDDNSGITIASRESENKPVFEIEKGLPLPNVEVEGFTEGEQVMEDTIIFNVNASSVSEDINLTKEVTVNGERVSEVDGTYTAQLISGKNKICVVVTDHTGNRVEKNYIVTYVDEGFLQIFEQGRKKWAEQQTMNNLYGTGNADYEARMVSLAEEVEDIWGSMNKYDPASGSADKREELWPEYDSKKVSADLSYSFSNLRKMATAYAAKGCTLYQNEELLQDILLGLDWMYANRYNENIGTVYDNWYHFNISGPQELGSTLIMLYDKLSDEQIEDHLRALNHFNKDPFVSIGIYDNVIKMEAANLLDKLVVKGLTGLIANSDSDLIFTGEAMCTTLPYVTKGNGFYEDGSYVDHATVPYAGGYGGSLMKGLSQILSIIQGTPWEVTDPLINNVYDWIIDSFEPLYYKGAIMDMVSGRGISRQGSSDHAKGKGLLIQMLNLAQTAPEPKKTQILSFIKENIEEDTVCEDYFKGMNTNDVILVKKLLADDSIIARGDLALHKVYGAMDRTVHHRPGFSLGISMFSERISAYEVGNGENKKAWHTADGMLYLYNDDHKQFSEDFWPTVDPMRLPGITTDHSTRKNADWYDYLSSKSWVGGSSIYDRYGATGMEFEMEPGKSTLTGKKSWFMFDDEIVCLGAGINSSDNTPVETIVENRKIKDSGDNILIVDGQEPMPDFGEVTLEAATWAFLGGNTEAGTDTIGYYFPESNSLKVRREVRTGNWKDINSDGSADPITKNYVSLATAHGDNPEDAKYSYVLLPNKSQEEVASYSQSADISIVANTKDVQAVKENNLGVLGINFWNAGSIEDVTAKNPCSVMIGEKGQTLSLGISDPTHLEEEVVVVLDKANYEVKSKDNTVQVEETEEGIKITVKTDKSLGKTHKVELVSSIEAEGSKVSMEAPITVNSQEEFTVRLGVSQVNELVYAQDLMLGYDYGIFELKDIEGLNKTEVITKDKGNGVWRILTATEGGLSSELPAIELYFKTKNVTAETIGTIEVSKASAGTVADGTSVKVDLEQVSREVKVKIPVVEGDKEDTNKDNVVDIADLALVAYYYQAKVGDTNWEQAKRADVNQDGEVNITDLSLVASKILENH